MTDKTPRPSFQPAPRPRPINPAGSAEALQEATRDLGFTRKTSPEEATPPEAQASVAAPAKPALAPAPAPVIAPRAAQPALVGPNPVAKIAPKPKTAKVEPAPSYEDRETSIKFAISDELSTALKLDAVQRRVTVKYIILEALAEKGYPIDLVNLPQDGRRARK